MEIDQGRLFFLGHLPGGIGELVQGGIRFALPEAAAFHGSHYHGLAVPSADLLKILFQPCLVSGEGAAAGGLFLLIIVAKLDKNIIAWLEGLEDFFEPELTPE